jgi:hypothetical protein
VVSGGGQDYGPSDYGLASTIGWRSYRRTRRRRASERRRCDRRRERRRTDRGRRERGRRERRRSSCESERRIASGRERERLRRDHSLALLSSCCSPYLSVPSLYLSSSSCCSTASPSSSRLLAFYGLCTLRHVSCAPNLLLSFSFFFPEGGEGGEREREGHDRVKRNTRARNNVFR